MQRRTGKPMPSHSSEQAVSALVAILRQAVPRRAAKLVLDMRDPLSRAAAKLRSSSPARRRTGKLELYELQDSLKSVVPKTSRSHLGAVRIAQALREFSVTNLSASRGLSAQERFSLLASCYADGAHSQEVPPRLKKSARRDRMLKETMRQIDLRALELRRSEIVSKYHLAILDRSPAKILLAAKCLDELDELEAIKRDLDKGDEATADSFVKPNDASMAMRHLRDADRLLRAINKRLMKRSAMTRVP